MSENWTELLKAYLIEVEHIGEPEASRLISDYKDVVVAGIAHGNIAATAMALQMRDDQACPEDEDPAGPQGPKGPTGPDGRIKETT